MHFAPDTQQVLEWLAAFANTDPGASRTRTDELATVGQLANLVERWEFSGPRDGDEAELHAVRAVRDELRQVWTLRRDQSVPVINRMLREARALPYLYRHDDSDWHLHATETDAPLAQRIRVEAAMALVDVVRMDETFRLRVCEADDCTGLFVDFSRNGSKRFCSVRCGNRMNMIAFRERRAGT